MPLTIEHPSTAFHGGTTAPARNDASADGAWVRNAMARQLNHLLARQGCIIPGKSVLGRQPRSVAAESRLWVTRYQAGPNGRTLVVTVRLAPTDTLAGSPRWYVKVDAVKQVEQRHNVRGATGVQFSDVFEMRQEIAVRPGVRHTVELWTADHCRVVGWALHEKPRDSLLVAADKVADYSYALPLSPIRADTVRSALSAADSAWRQLRGCHVSWNVDDPATPSMVGSTVPVALWGSSTVGPVAPTAFRNSYANERLLGGLAKRLIPMVCWAAAARLSGPGSLVVRFLGNNHAGGVDLVIGGGLQIYETTSFSLLPAMEGDTIRVECLTSSGQTLGAVHAVGCFPLVM